MGAFEQTLLVVSVLLLLSIISSKTSSQLGVPALLLFLSLGMLAGSDGPGGIYFDNARLAQSLGVLALTFILFSGGLETDWQHIRPVLAGGMVLATLGVMLTAGLVGLFATMVLGFSPVEGLLLGAVVSSTDAAAVFAILRSRNVGLKGSLKPLLELESGSNDPMAVLLTVALLQLLTGTVSSPPEFALTMVRQLARRRGRGLAPGQGHGLFGQPAAPGVRGALPGAHPGHGPAHLCRCHGRSAATASWPSTWPD